MKFSLATIAFVATLSLSQNCDAFTSPGATSVRSLGAHAVGESRLQVSMSEIDAPAETADGPSTTATALEWREIRNLPYRQLQKHLKARELEPIGTTAVLRERLHMASGGECIVDEGAAIGNCADEQIAEVRLHDVPRVMRITCEVLFHYCI
jgi:hypothetical protein